MRYAVVLLLVLAVSPAEARWVRVYGWQWWPDRIIHMPSRPMSRAEIRTVFPRL